jgi:hypothetical protein
MVDGELGTDNFSKLKVLVMLVLKSDYKSTLYPECVGGRRLPCLVLNPQINAALSLSY